MPLFKFFSFVLIVGLSSGLRCNAAENCSPYHLAYALMDAGEAESRAEYALTNEANQLDEGDEADATYRLLDLARVRSDTNVLWHLLWVAAHMNDKGDLAFVNDRIKQQSARFLETSRLWKTEMIQTLTKLHTPKIVMLGAQLTERVNAFEPIVLPCQ